MSCIQEITSSDANLFLEYIFPALKGFSLDPDYLVRCTFVECLVSLSEISLLFLDLAQVLKSQSEGLDNDEYHPFATYDSSLRDIHECIKDEIQILLLDPEPIVKRALLKELPRFCIFFGRQGIFNYIYTKIINMRFSI